MLLKFELWSIGVEVREETWLILVMISLYFAALWMARQFFKIWDAKIQFIILINYCLSKSQVLNNDINQKAQYED